MLRQALITIVALSVAAPCAAQSFAADTASVIPRPVSLAGAAGQFTLTSATVVWADRSTLGVARSFARALEPATGLTLDVRSGTSSTGSRIVFRRDTSLAATLGAEGYRLSVRPGVITIRAAQPAGAFYAAQTLRQLLPVEIFREAKVDGVKWTMPSVTIEDRPRFGWRGSHLDVARHFMPKEYVKKHIDLLALHKMNVFHWHLTEDQGWRIEIKKYPRLTEVGAWRSETLVGTPVRDTAAMVFDKKRHGGFYTQDDVREIVAYAAERFITVLPEIEMPGHAQAAIAAYPWLGNRPDTIRVWNRWGVSQNILNPSDSTIAFMKDVLTEVMALFPSKFIHIGGDEATKEQWRSSAFAQARIKELGLKDENELQSWFIRQMDDFLTKNGRRLVGWDEIVEGGLAPNAVVMAWRSARPAIEAATEGHDVVMALNAKSYFDHYQARPTSAEPLAIGGFLPIDSVYAHDPMPPTLDPQFRKHVLGAQAQLWTEYMPNPKHVEYMAFPRMSALSESLWTPLERKDFANFNVRLKAHLDRLRILDVNFRGR
jgi:hexosaminidase